MGKRIDFEKPEYTENNTIYLYESGYPGDPCLPMYIL